MARFFPRAVAALSLLVATPAAAEWREASTDHFLIYADAGESWVRAFAQRLERASGALRLLRPQHDPAGERSNRVVIYAVSGVDGVQKLCGKCGSVAGFYVPRVGHSVAYTARTSGGGELDMTSDIVLLHEYAHHFMFSNTGSAYPRWYAEGFAEFFSTIQVAKDGSVEIGRPAKHRAYNLVNANMKIERLFDPPSNLDAEATDIFYGRSWMLNHMLTFDTARAGQLDRYLTLFNSGKSSLEAARGAFGDLATLQKQLNAYVEKPLRAVRLSNLKNGSGVVVVRVLTPGEAAMMPIRLRSDRGVDRQQALKLVPDARRRAAPFAADSGAQAVLAEAEYDAGNDAEAEAAAERALAADPKNIEAMLYKGRVLVRRAATAKSVDPKTWRAARAWFVRANAVDPNAAEPLMLFHSSFAAAGVKPTANAAAGLARAFELSPQDPGLRLAAAHQLLVDGKVKEARLALLPLAYSPHLPADNFAARIVAMIDAGKPAGELLGQKPTASDEVENPGSLGFCLGSFSIKAIGGCAELAERDPKAHRHSAQAESERVIFRASKPSVLSVSEHRSAGERRFAAAHGLNVDTP